MSEHDERIKNIIITIDDMFGGGDVQRSRWKIAAFSGTHYD